MQRFFKSRHAHRVIKNCVSRSLVAQGIERLEGRVLFAVDLALDIVTPPAASLIPNGKNQVVVKMVNIGDEAAAGGVTIFASTDPVFDPADVSIATSAKPAKVGGLSDKDVKIKFISPANLPDGSYTLFARVDPAAGVVEDDTNNVTPFAAPVEIRQPFVDLVTTVPDLPAGPLEITPKLKPIKGSIIVTNNGNVPARGPAVVTLYASLDTVLDDSDISIPGITKTVKLNPTQQKPIKVKVTLPQEIASGDYHLLANVGFGGLPAEVLLADNVGFSSNIVTIVNANIPPTSTEPSLSSLSVDAEVLAVSSPEQLTFDVTLLNPPAGSTIVLNEVQADGVLIGTVANLLDNGSAANSDGAAGDNIFSGSTAIQFNAPGDRYFQAQVVGTALVTPLVKLSGVTAPTEAALQQAQDNAVALQAQADAALAGGQGEAAALESVRQGLIAQPTLVRPDSISVGAHTIAWQSTEGILMVVSTSTLPLNPRETVDENAVPAASVLGSTSDATTDPGTTTITTSSTDDASAAEKVPPADCGCGGTTSTTSASGQLAVAAEGDPATCSRAIVLSPERAAFIAAGGGDSAALVAQRLTLPPGGEPGFSVATRFNADADLDAFKGLGQFKAVYIASATVIDTPDFGVIIPSGEAATALSRLGNVADLVSNRLAITGDGRYAMTPKFFQHYNGDMDGAIVIANVEFSTRDISLGSAFLRHGAKAYIGFSQAQTELRGSIAAGIVEQLVGETGPGLTVDESLAVVNNTIGGTASSFGSGESKLERGCDLLSDNDLFIQYTWNQSVRDLDTSTEFLGAKAGFACGAGNSYMTFTGDDTGNGGSEKVTINLNDAFIAAAFTGSTSVTANAGWFQPAGGSGPALLTVALKNKTTGELSQVLTRTVSPGTQNGCAATLAGVINITLTAEADPRVSLTLT